MKKLKRNLEELFEKGIDFVRDVKGKKTFLIYHKDADGICSAAILLKVFEKLGSKPTEIIASSNEEIKETIKKIKNFDKAIILDIDICYLKKELENLDRSILLIDHHPPRTDLNSEKIVYINPGFEFEKVYQPVSYITFKLFSRISDLGDAEWAAVLGTIGDLGLEDCKDLVGKWTNAKSKSELVKTQFWQDVGRLNGCATTFGFEKTLDILKTFSSVEDFRRSDKIEKAYREYDKKYKKLEQIFWKNAKTIKEINLIISEIKSEHRTLSSFLSTNTALEHQNKVIVIMRKANGEYAINARYEGVGLNLGKIMEEAAKGLNGGGGHFNAAGATIKAKNKEIFKERLIKELKRVSGKKA